MIVIFVSVEITQRNFLSSLYLRILYESIAVCFDGKSIITDNLPPTPSKVLVSRSFANTESANDSIQGRNASTYSAKAVFVTVVVTSQKPLDIKLKINS